MSMEVYGNLCINMKIRVFVDIYGSLCTSMGGSGVYETIGGFSESIDKYEYAGIYRYSWEIIIVYGQI